MLTEANEPYLGDFGVARSLSAEDITILVSSPTGGKPKYAAPEIWNGNELSIRSDIYSFGRVALEFLTRTDKLFTAKFSDIKPPLEQGLREILERCCENNPVDRPVGINDVCAAFISGCRRSSVPSRLIAVLCVLSLGIGLVLGSMIPDISKKETNEQTTNQQATNIVLEPLPPGNLKVEAPEPNELHITWDAPSVRPNGYEIRWREHNEEKWNTEQVDADTDRYEIRNGIQPNTLYTVELLSYNRPSETKSVAVNENKRTPQLADAPPLPPPPPAPEWLKYVRVKKGGVWVKPDETDKLDEFTQWKVDGTVDQFVDRELVRFIDDVKSHLVHLELLKCNDLTQKGYAKLVDARGMTDLTIRNCTRFDDRAVRLLFPKLKTETKKKNEPAAPLNLIGELADDLLVSPIKRMDIIGCPVTDASLEYLPKTLERLRLDSCSKITDKGLSMIVSRFQELRHLSIRNTGATFEGIPKLVGLGWSSNYLTIGTTANIVKKSKASSLSKLRKLELNGCSMKGYRGNFRLKLKKGLEKYCENLEVIGLEP